LPRRKERERGRGRIFIFFVRESHSIFVRSKYSILCLGGADVTREEGRRRREDLICGRNNQNDTMIHKVPTYEGKTTTYTSYRQLRIGTYLGTMGGVGRAIT
jgi:hypothetical protein